MIQDLVVKLENANGPSCELDAEIRVALLADEGCYAAKSPFNGEWCVYKGEDRNGKPKLFENRRVPHTLWVGEYTASLNAAAALAERLLPSAPVIIGWKQTPETRPWARVGTWTGADATGATPAIALVIAALSALSQQEESRG